MQLKMSWGLLCVMSPLKMLKRGLELQPLARQDLQKCYTAYETYKCELSVAEMLTAHILSRRAGAGNRQHWAERTL